jgi:serine/threonine protein kinase
MLLAEHFDVVEVIGQARTQQLCRLLGVISLGDEHQRMPAGKVRQRLRYAIEQCEIRVAHFRGQGRKVVGLRRRAGCPGQVFEACNQRMVEGVSSVAMCLNAGCLQPVEGVTNLGGCPRGMCDQIDKAIDGTLKVDVVFPERVIRVDHEYLLLITETWRGNSRRGAAVWGEYGRGLHESVHSVATHPSPRRLLGAFCPLHPVYYGAVGDMRGGCVPLLATWKLHRSGIPQEIRTMDEPGPKQFGPYVVLEEIGWGGMGSVYRARDQRLGRDVAIKSLHRNLEIAGAKERFLREARAVSSLNHPNICTVFDIGEQDGEPYLVMELLVGASLKDWLTEGVATSSLELETIAAQAAMALAAAHAKGIVHRDIKPANLFVLGEGHDGLHLKVLDFGLAKLESERWLHGREEGITRTGSTVGTVEYMSPEQARGEHLDARSDLFSLGAVLYELATGDIPFPGPTSAVIFAELLGNDPIPARTANPRVSPAMYAIIQRLLEKRLDRRFQSATQLLTALRDLKRSRATAARAAAVDALRAESSQMALAVTRSAEKPASPNSELAVTDPTARPSRPKAPMGSRTSMTVQEEFVDEGAGMWSSASRAEQTAESAEKSGAKLRWLIVVAVVAGIAVIVLLLLHR